MKRMRGVLSLLILLVGSVAPAPAGASDTLQNHVRAFWSMDSATYTDSSFNGVALTSSSTTNGVGRLGNAVTTNGSASSNLSHANDLLMRGSTSSYSFSFYIKINTLSTYNDFISRYTIQNDYLLRYDNARQQVRFYTYSIASTNIAFLDYPLAVGVWYHIYAGYDSGARIIQVGVGALRSSVYISPPDAPATNYATDPAFFLFAMDRAGLAVRAVSIT